jgi:nucleoside-diphosphate-sugar epimerase
MHVLVAGCGWLGSAIARVLVARGDRVSGVRREAGRAGSLAALGVAPLPVDLAAPGAGRALPRDVDAVIACQSASGDDEGAYRRAYVDANRTLLDLAAASGARAFVYTGSTGLFGQRDGSDVDEVAPPAPASRTAEILAEAEALVSGAAMRGVPACLVRLSGLYGPGRLGTIDRVRRGALALGPGDDAWMNFCHLEDAVTAVVAALDRGRAGGVYHGSDAGPARRREVVEWIAARLGIEPPRRADAVPGPSRRVLAARTRAELGIALGYPSFREGFAEHLPAR